MIVYYAWGSIEQDTALAPLLHDIKSSGKNIAIPLEWAKSPNGILKCPAFVQSIKNTYVAKSPLAYSFSWDKTSKGVTSDMYSQKEFDEFLQVRDASSGVVTFNFPRYVFYSETPLTMGVEHAKYHCSDFQEKTVYLGAEYNIGRHMRFTEAAVVVKNSGQVCIREGDPLYYVRFFTDEPVKLVPFHMSPTIQSLGNKLMGANKYGGRKPLKFWYDLHDRVYGKRLLKEIKNNLLG